GRFCRGIFFILWCIHFGSPLISAFVPSLERPGIKRRWAMLVAKCEAFIQPIISLIRCATFPAKGKIHFNIRHPWLRFGPMVLNFWACLEGSGKESSEKYRVSEPRVVDSDLLDHKRTEHASA